MSLSDTEAARPLLLSVLVALFSFEERRFHHKEEGYITDQRTGRMVAFPDVQRAGRWYSGCSGLRPVGYHKTTSQHRGSQQTLCWGTCQSLCLKSPELAHNVYIPSATSNSSLSFPGPTEANHSQGKSQAVAHPCTTCSPSTFQPGGFPKPLSWLTLLSLACKSGVSENPRFRARSLAASRQIRSGISHDSLRDEFYHLVPFFLVPNADSSAFAGCMAPLILRFLELAGGMSHGEPFTRIFSSISQLKAALDDQRVRQDKTRRQNVVASRGPLR
ncbi:hypothetical protein F5144DRAFT_211598 [Chaetomium tenue]|uniref:Uncharacterized protein n=1 Tax=Chaetomium tenue TaxID=1854479 RepID=A0ACB7PGD9_9PEZI|nr:hypothetical protein F5144DRAFT_211598 [Chaetomium globosum]